MRSCLAYLVIGQVQVDNVEFVLPGQANPLLQLVEGHKVARHVELSVRLALTITPRQLHCGLSLGG